MNRRPIILFSLALIAITFLALNLNDKSKNEETSLKKDFNNSIIDGFFNGDTTNIDTTKVYFLK